MDLKIVNLKCQTAREVGLPVLPSPASIYTCIRRTRLSGQFGGQKCKTWPQFGPLSCSEAQINRQDWTYTI